MTLISNLFQDFKGLMNEKSDKSNSVISWSILTIYILGCLEVLLPYTMTIIWDLFQDFKGVINEKSDKSNSVMSWLI
ncbi:hypothetical protein LYNGBM3L_34610 [Moorena producens 3L]|uniref:Uncharacterized protein n=1 Tax=Moorena producens 3L TaxID=489825 RepID=F4XPP2_9CYAN|nr:hypothetical protein LYNGBM3L_34610 [Moorena producens 3L]OLT63955.1 hypothetical protein BI334_01955 [Moorena producens 3L]